jgi:hypothetical protein
MKPYIANNWLRITARSLAIAAVLCVVGAAPARAQPISGSHSWGEYSFNWEFDNSAGLAITDVTYGGTYYIFRASMPIIRVQYNEDACGPFMDRIGTSFIVKGEDGNYVRFAELDGKLYASVKAQIASYSIEQQWIFNDGGRIDARFFSSGLQCMSDHRHHPYWRIDPDISGTPENDEIRARYTDGCTQIMRKEFNRRKNTSPKVSWWIFRDTATRRQLLVVPGSSDGNGDSFAGYDFYGRAFHEPWEGEPWASDTGGFEDQGDLLLPSADGERTGPGSAMTDVVGWYTAHLAHAVSIGSTQQLSVGPSLLLR